MEELLLKPVFFIHRPDIFLYHLVLSLSGFCIMLSFVFLRSCVPFIIYWLIQPEKWEIANLTWLLSPKPCVQSTIDIQFPFV